MIAALLLLSGLAFGADPLPWFDLEEGQELSLTQEIILSGHLFVPGTRLWLEEKEPLSLPGAPLSFFAFYQSPCPNPNIQSELEIVVPAGNPESSSVGVELSKGCNWGVYVENKDIFTRSFLSTP